MERQEEGERKTHKRQSLKPAAAAERKNAHRKKPSLAAGRPTEDRWKAQLRR